jgi:hypothetical protein
MSGGVAASMTDCCVALDFGLLDVDDAPNASRSNGGRSDGSDVRV